MQPNDFTKYKKNILFKYLLYKGDPQTKENMSRVKEESTVFRLLVFFD